MKPKNDYKNVVVLLPGRGQPAMELFTRYSLSINFDDTQLAAIEPKEEWYPAPRGSKNQTDAVEGLKSTVPKLNKFISDNFESKNVVLLGFSAGAVIAIQLAAQTNLYSGVVVHNGAILEPENLSPCQTPFLLLHSKDDDCFSWHERYLPMKKAFLEKGFKVNFIENELGGHSISAKDRAQASNWIASIFNHPVKEHTGEEDFYEVDLDFYE